MEYRNNDYFNDQDFYVVQTNLNKVLVTKMFLHNGNWYTNVGMQYKATSVPTIKAKELLYHTEIKRKNFIGTVVKFLEPSHVGVVWNQGQRNNPYYFWNNLNKIK